MHPTESPLSDAHLTLEPDAENAELAAARGLDGEKEGDTRCWMSWRRLPFCWECGGGWWCGCQTWWCNCSTYPRQGTKCSFSSICSWAATAFALTWVLFFLAIFWSCISMPVGELIRPEDVVATEQVVHENSARHHHSESAVQRSAQGLVRVLSYNMFLRPDLLTDASTSGSNDFKEERLQLFIQRLDDYDVLLLQETWMVNSATRKERLVSAARSRGFRFWVRAACHGDAITAMLLILSRHPLTASDEHSYSARVGLEVLASKGALRARAWINGNSACAVDFYNTHLQAGEEENGGDDVRSKQTKELATFVSREWSSFKCVTVCVCVCVRERYRVCAHERGQAREKGSFINSRISIRILLHTHSLSLSCTHTHSLSLSQDLSRSRSLSFSLSLYFPLKHIHTDTDTHTNTIAMTE